MIRRNLFAAFIATVVFISSCQEKSSTIPSGLTYTYFPGNIGHEVIYDATLITRDEFTGDDDTLVFQIKEVVESVFMDNQNRPTLRLERYKRDTPNDPWVISDVWTANRTSTLLEKKEDNITYIKLIFPMVNSASWNGNALNNLGSQDYEYQSVHTGENVGGQFFDSTATILQIDEDNFIEKKYAVEKFAAGVGLIYKQQIEIDKDYTNPNIPGISSQRLYTETINSWTN